MNKGDTDKAQLNPLTMVDAGGARWNQAGNIPRNGVIVDALILLQFKSTIYQCIAEHKISIRQSCEAHDSFCVPLTGQRCNRSER